MQIDQDIFAFKEFIKQESTDLGKKLKEHRIEFSYTPQIQINLSRLEANIAEYVQFTQKYETEKKQLQFSDYMRAATAPFMGVMSLFLISRFIPALKVLTQYMWLIGLILIPIAVYSFYKFLQNTKARKAHDYDTELNRTRESLLAETKGMIRKVTDEWQREIIGALREEQNQLVNTLELVFAETAKVHKDKIQQTSRSIHARKSKNLVKKLELVFSEEAKVHKDKIQHTSRSIHARKSALDQLERNHESVLKNKDNYVRSLAQLKGELKNQYQEQLEQL